MKEARTIEVSLFDIGLKAISEMRDLSFTQRHVRSGPIYSKRVTMTLLIPGMLMGKNTVILFRRVASLHSVMGIIPRCPSGKKLWEERANLTEARKVYYFFVIID